MTIAFGFTSADLERMPDIEGVRYEIIDGDHYLSWVPGEPHQYIATMLTSLYRVGTSRAALA